MQAGISMTTESSWAAKYRQYKPRLIALVVGLVLGPLLTNFFGWQMTVGAANAQRRAGIVEQQARFCEVKARADVADPGKLDWTARNELARKWAIMPGRTDVDSDVVSACSDKLAG